MAYDSARDRLVVYGGNDWCFHFCSTGAGRDLWEFDGQSWIALGNGPHLARYPAMAYDEARGNTVLFGGLTGSSAQTGETWAWDGQAWRLAATEGPTARFGHSMVYDSVRREVMLFGGLTALGNRQYEYHGDTWAWDGQTWRLAATEGPRAGGGHGMAFDSHRELVVLFGGVGPESELFGDTWEWNGTRWIRRDVPGPSPRSAHAMAYDAARGVTVAAGGTELAAGIRDAWEWNGSAWRQVGHMPGERHSAALAYDSTREVLVLFAGTPEYAFSYPLNDLWTYGAPDMYADCDRSTGKGVLDLLDFLCFQNEFLAGGPYADCDGNAVLDFFDFLCFQNEFLAGCP